MNIRLRLLGILLLVFMAVFFDFKNGGLRFEMLSGTCESYDFSSEKCFSGEQLNTVSMIPMYFDPPSIILILVITLLGAGFKGNGLVDSMERASHLAKDAGELGAAIGAIQTFMGVFNEAAISFAFGFVFSTYFAGLMVALICSTIANYFRAKENSNKLLTP